MVGSYGWLLNLAPMIIRLDDLQDDFPKEKEEKTPPPVVAVRTARPLHIDYLRKLKPAPFRQRTILEVITMNEFQLKEASRPNIFILQNAPQYTVAFSRGFNNENRVNGKKPKKLKKVVIKSDALKKLITKTVSELMEPKAASFHLCIQKVVMTDGEVRGIFGYTRLFDKHASNIRKKQTFSFQENTKPNLTLT